MNHPCRAATRRNTPCPNHPAASGYCFAHAPARARERAAARRKGGQRSRLAHRGNADTLPQQVRTFQDIYHLLDYALAETLSLPNNIHRGRLLLAIAHGFGEALQEGALEERIGALEAALQEQSQET